ncbi:MAG TPA: cytochrome b/b6 domain-containing protein [Novosphingobium sp.]
MKVWDLPTRLFHWLIVLLVGFSWWSAETGHMDWHYKSGMMILNLVTFRIVWGLIGGSTARFARFVKSPGAVLAYLRRPKGAPHDAGHNPLGGYSVVALLLVLATQVGTGVFSVDVDGIESGPLSPLVSFETGRLAAKVHHLSFTVLQVLVALHLVAILYYRIRGRKLIGPMVTGRDAQLAASTGGLVSAGWLRFVVAVAIAFTLGWWVSAGAPH